MDLVTLPRVTRLSETFRYTTPAWRNYDIHPINFTSEEEFFCIVCFWVFPPSGFKWVKTEAHAPHANNFSTQMSIDIRDFFRIFLYSSLFLELFTLLTSFHCEQPPCCCNVTNSTKTEDPKLWGIHLDYSFVAKIAQRISVLSLQSLDGNVSFSLTSWYNICFSSASELDRPEVIPLPIHLHLEFLHSACQRLLQKGDKAGTWQIGTVIVFNMPQKK